MTRLIRRDSSTVVQYLLVLALVGAITEKLPLPWFFPLILIEVLLLMELVPDLFTRANMRPERIEKYEKAGVPKNQIGFYLRGTLGYQVLFLLSILGYLFWAFQGEVSAASSHQFLFWECLCFFLYRLGLRIIIWIRKKRAERFKFN